MARRFAPGVFALVLTTLLGLPTSAAEPVVAPSVETECRFDPAGDDAANVPERYRLTARTFGCRLTPRYTLRHSGVEVYDLTFPSPVKSGFPVNDTVYAEYFVPVGASEKAKVPGVVVLDILDGAAVVSRGEAVWLAQNGVASLFVYMAHYGPRRTPGSKVRLLSTNVEQSLNGVRQTVLDCRCATAWLAARPEVDGARLGLVGTSLGSIVGANVAAGEPRLKNICLLLPAGGLVDAFYDHPKAKQYLPLLDLVEVLGGKDRLRKMIAPADPITYAPQLKQKNLLLIAASRDDVLPPKSAEALWEATGKQKIVWFDSTHVGAAAYAIPALKAVTEHVKR